MCSHLRPFLALHTRSSVGYGIRIGIERLWVDDDDFVVFVGDDAARSSVCLEGSEGAHTHRH